jgi:FixJ family two-component response regulator
MTGSVDMNTVCESANIFVVDDDDGVRRSLVRLMHAEGWHAEGFSCGGAFLARLPYDGVGCVMLDVEMPGMKGPELQDRMLGDGISLPVIYLTGHGDVPNSVHAMKCGAVDFLTKPADDDLIVQTVNAAIGRHASFLQRESERCEIARRLSRLSDREREVMELVICGRLNKQIAGDLGITERTVKVHRARVMQKLETRSVAGLVRLCVAVGFDTQRSDPPAFASQSIMASAACAMR